MRDSDIKEICRILGISPQTLRQGLKDKIFPFGGCIGKASYVLFPIKVKEYLGYTMEVMREENKDIS